MPPSRQSAASPTRFPAAPARHRRRIRRAAGSRPSSPAEVERLQQQPARSAARCCSASIGPGGIRASGSSRCPSVAPRFESSQPASSIECRPPVPGSSRHQGPGPWTGCRSFVSWGGNRRRSTTDCFTCRARGSSHGGEPVDAVGVEERGLRAPPPSTQTSPGRAGRSWRRWWSRTGSAVSAPGPLLVTADGPRRRELPPSAAPGPARFSARSSSTSSLRSRGSGSNQLPSFRPPRGARAGPVAQLQGGEAVVAVVGGDVVEGVESSPRSSHCWNMTIETGPPSLTAVSRCSMWKDLEAS